MIPIRQSSFVISGLQVLGLLVLFAPVSAMAGKVFNNLSLAYTNDSNVSRAGSGYVYSDSILSASIGGDRTRALNKRNQLVYRYNLVTDRYSTFDKLSRIAADFSVNWRYRASGGFTVPTYGLNARLTGESYGSTLRSGMVLELGGSVQKPLTDRVTATAIIEMRQRDANSTAFDTSNTSARLNIDYLLGQRSTLYLTYNRITGDMVLSAPSGYSGYKTWKSDDAFYGGWWAYRFDATTDAGTLGFNYAFNEKNAVDLSLVSVSSQASGGLSYTSTIAGIAWLKRF